MAIRAKNLNREAGRLYRRNLTLSLPRDLLYQAKSHAAQQRKTLSDLVRESLEDKLERQKKFALARERQMRRLRTGYDLKTNGELCFFRADLHATSQREDFS